jgi:hypothetical protein
MAVEVAAQVVWLAKWFHDELRANPGVKGEVKEVAECVDRWSAVLQSGAGCKVLDNPRGLHHAHPVLHHVCQCLHDAKVFYEKYKHGWGTCARLRVHSLLSKNCMCPRVGTCESDRCVGTCESDSCSATSCAEFPRKRTLKVVDHAKSDHRKGQGPKAQAPGRTIQKIWRPDESKSAVYSRLHTALSPSSGVYLICLALCVGGFPRVDRCSVTGNSRRRSRLANGSRARGPGTRRRAAASPAGRCTRWPGN